MTDSTGDARTTRTRRRRSTASVLLAGACLGGLVLTAAPAAAGEGGGTDATTGTVRAEPGGIDIRAVVLDLRVGTADLDGAVSTTRTGTVARVTLDADVLFAFDRADLSPSAQGRLDDTAAALPASTGPIQVDGYTDAEGDRAYNQSLSERRARAVADALGRAQPAVSARLAPQGHGAADPVAPNTKPDGSDNPAGRAENRRVTITYTVAEGRG
jgi:outer membrane protein OmpA-like peptidoglycan-associated protein